MPYVFGYGSLVSRASLEASLGRVLDDVDAPRPARLRDHRRAWNVAAHSTVRPDYHFERADGTEWAGWMGFLGIEASATDTTLGAVCRLTEPDLALLDVRELDYERVDVSELVEPLDGRLRDAPVHTYRPTAATVRTALEQGPAVVVMARYLRLVDAAYRSLGEALHAEHLGTYPDPAPFVVEEILVRPVAAGTVNQAVDPRPPDRRRSGKGADRA